MSEFTVVESKLSQYVKAHERLIIVALLSAVFIFGYTKTITLIADRDKLKYQQTAATLTAQIEANKKADVVAQQTIAQYKALAEQLAAQNATLTAARSQRAVVTQKQQEVDKTLPPSALADRWTTLVNVDAANVKPSPEGYQVTQEAAVDTVTRLEMVPQLQEDLVGADKIIANDADQTRSLNGVVSALQLQVSGRDTQIADQTAACKAEVTSVKADARKSKWKWILAAFGAGLGLGLHGL